MSEATMPTGWMSADEARRWARRGVWAYRRRERREVVLVPYPSRESMINGNTQWGRVLDIETWRYLCPHPDDLDAPAPVAVETVERWQAFVGFDGDAPENGPVDGFEPSGPWEPVSHAMCEPNMSWQSGYSVMWRRKLRSAPVPTVRGTVTL